VQLIYACSPPSGINNGGKLESLPMRPIRALSRSRSRRRLPSLWYDLSTAAGMLGKRMSPCRRTWALLER